MIHGWGMNAAIFEPILPLLEPYFEVIRVELPGHGRSAWIPAQDFDRQVDAIARQLPSSILLGWSLGGLYAIRLAGLYPQQFKKLVLVANNPCFVQRADWPCAVEQQVFDEFSSDLMVDWQATMRRFIGLQIHGMENARQMIRRISDLLVRGGAPQPQSLALGLDLLLNHDARAELASIKQPVMTILGRRDKLVPACVAEQIPLINPEIRVECLARSAHAPFISHAEPVAELLREFIESASPR